MSARDSALTSESIFLFQYWQQRAMEPGQRISVIYVARSTARDTDIRLLLRKHLELTYEPHRVIVLASAHFRETLEKLQLSKSLNQTLVDLPGHEDEQRLEYALVSGDGHIASLDHNMTFQWTADQTQELFAAGLALMFQMNGAALDSRNQGFHYVAPSGRHQSSFVRVATVFSHGSQTSFAASALLRFIPTSKQYESIFVDSSTISALAYELAVQICELRGQRHRPVVATFGGYEGLESSTQPMPSDQSIVLISYSATGRLAEALRVRRGVSSSVPVLSIYSDGLQAGGDPAICRLDVDNGVGQRVDLSSDSVDPELERCAECDRGSSTIVISGDQLLPLSPRTKIAQVKPSHAPASLSKDLQDLVQHSAIRVNARQDLEMGYTREVFLDLESLSTAMEAGPAKSDGSVISGARKRLLGASSKSVSWIIHTDDEPSQAMARMVLSQSVKKRSKITEANIVSAHHLLYENQRPAMGVGTVVVVAGAVASGRTLDLLSEFLRSAHPRSTIHWVILFARGSDEPTWSKAMSNWRYGERNPNRHILEEPPHIELAPLRKDVKTPWEQESDFWNSILDLLPGLEDEEKRAARRGLITRRLEQIEYFESMEESATQGLRDTLFLSGLGSETLATHRGAQHHLELQPNFAFWNFGYPESGVGQADVYITFSAVLNRMRNATKTTSEVIDQRHDRTCIDPSDFTRYSDGVAQAALLRAAQPIELDYSNDFELSAALYTILEALVLKPSSPGGNALPEFLLAIAMLKLRLHPAHLELLRPMLVAQVTKQTQAMTILIDALPG